MEITWRPAAVDDIENARTYIAVHDPQAAARIVRAVLAAVQRLADRPLLGRPGRVEGTRELVVPRTPYLVAYAAVGDQLVILAILHGAQEWPESF